MAINDPTPLKLRAADQADVIPQMLYELNQHVRNVRDDALRARDLHTRTKTDEDGRVSSVVLSRACSRVQREIEEVHEGAARTCDLLENLTRQLRASGRL